MTCRLCHRPLDDLTVATTDGGRVHIVCADRSARAAYRARTIRAIVSGVLGLAMCSRAEGWGWRAVVIVVLIAAHVLINRRWWRYTVQSARRWI
jgi:hypothetical protein